MSMFSLFFLCMQYSCAVFSPVSKSLFDLFITGPTLKIVEFPPSSSRVYIFPIETFSYGSILTISPPFSTTSHIISYSSIFLFIFLSINLFKSSI